jgi:hypothetical protein
MASLIDSLIDWVIQTPRTATSRILVSRPLTKDRKFDKCCFEA